MENLEEAQGVSRVNQESINEERSSGEILNKKKETSQNSEK